MDRHFTLLTYNIRKGKGASGRSQTAFQDILSTFSQDPESPSGILTTPDLLLVQEVFHGIDVCPINPEAGQSHALGEVSGLRHYYGANKHRRVGHHGNSTLTSHHVAHVQNHDLSLNPLERRGVLHAVVHLGERRLHVLNTHLSLTARQRQRQLQRIGKVIAETIPGDEPVVLAGDFNDWNGRLDTMIEDLAGLQSGVPKEKWLPTWPSRRPIFNLDRVYVRGLDVVDFEYPDDDRWRQMSDHLPLHVALRFR